MGFSGNCANLPFLATIKVQQFPSFSPKTLDTACYTVAGCVWRLVLPHPLRTPSGQRLSEALPVLFGMTRGGDTGNCSLLMREAFKERVGAPCEPHPHPPLRARRGGAQTTESDHCSRGVRFCQARFASHCSLLSRRVSRYTHGGFHGAEVGKRAVQETLGGDQGAGVRAASGGHRCQRGGGGGSRYHGHHPKVATALGRGVHDKPRHLCGRGRDGERVAPPGGAGGSAGHSRPGEGRRRPGGGAGDEAAGR